MTKTNQATIPMRARIESEIEPTDLMTLVVDTLVAEAPKKVTKRLEQKVTDALKAAFGDLDYDVHLYHSCGMTTLEYGGYSRSQGNRGSSILLAHHTRSEPIAQKYIDDMKRFLAAKHERNAVREAMLKSDAPERMDAAREAIRAAHATLTEIHDAGDNWKILSSPYRYAEEITNP